MARDLSGQNESLVSAWQFSRQRRTVTQFCNIVVKTAVMGIKAI